MNTILTIATLLIVSAYPLQNGVIVDTQDLQPAPMISQVQPVQTIHYIQPAGGHNLQRTVEGKSLQ